MTQVKKYILQNWSKVVYFIAALLATQIASASSSDLSSGLCGAVNIFVGPVGKFLAVFAVIALGVMMFLGKVTWGTAIAIGIGIFAIFGSIAIVNKISGGFSAGTSATGINCTLT